MIRQLLSNFRGTGPFLFAALAVITAALAGIAVWGKVRRNEPFWRGFWRLELPLLACWSVLAILLVGLRPGEVLTPPANSELQLDPLFEIRKLDPNDPWTGGSLLLGNVLLYIPAGFFVALWLTRLRAWQIILAGLGLSFGIELTQLLFVNDRSAATDDLILNTLGVAIGVLAARALSLLWRRGDSNP